MRISSIAALFLVASSSVTAMPVHAPWPGGVGVVRIYSDAAPSASSAGRSVAVVRDNGTWVALVGIPLEQAAPGMLAVDIEVPGQAPYIVQIDVRANDYEEQRLNVDRKYVEPGAQQLERIIAERKVIDAALNNVRDIEISTTDMSAPVGGRRSSSFGLRRFFNDQPRSPHKGMDIAATSGTPIAAPLAGVVTATGDYYFNGNTVIIDHGQGFISLYCHLSEIDAIPGQEIAAGTKLGEVGATGRVTGAHLHFATYLNGTAVDPALFLD